MNKPIELFPAAPDDGRKEAQTDYYLPLAVPDQKPDYLLGQQDAVSAHLNQNGTLFITQHSWPDDDAVIIIAADLVDLFVERLTDLLGDGSAGRRS